MVYFVNTDRNDNIESINQSLKNQGLSDHQAALIAPQMRLTSLRSKQFDAARPRSLTLDIFNSALAEMNL